jgi:hypothetical protein
MCENKVVFSVEVGMMRYKDFAIRCGTTDPYGGLALCEKCEHKRRAILTNSDEPEDWGYQDW